MGFPTKIGWAVPISHAPAEEKGELSYSGVKKDDVGLELENQLINDCT
jgi:hypothetical protein